MCELIWHDLLTRVFYLKSAVCQVDIANITLISMTAKDMIH